MTPQVAPGPERQEEPALVRRTLGWLIAGLCLAAVSATALAWLANTRVPRAVAVLIALGFLAGGFSSAVGTWLYFFRVPAATRAALPEWARGLARAGAVAAGATLLILAVVLFAAGSVK